MFGLPDAKRVRRSDLFDSRSPSPASPDHELEAQLNSRFDALYGPLPAFQARPEVFAKNESPIPANEEDQSSPEPAEDEPHAFEFRLFSTNLSKSETEPQTIILDEDDLGLGSGTFTCSRPHSFYFSQSAVGEQKQRYEISAFSTEDILARSKLRAWGLECPWRVKIIRSGIKHTSHAALSTGSSTSSKHASKTGEEIELTRKKKKAGKKRRIVLRERARVKAEKQAKEKAAREAKEAAERDKKTTKNREKKLKRRAKERAKKAELGGNGGDQGDGKDDSGDDGEGIGSRLNG